MRFGRGARVAGRPRRQDTEPCRPVQRRRDVLPELGAEQLGGRGQLVLHRRLVPGRGERSDEQHVRVLVERVGADQPRRELDRGANVVGGDRPQRTLAEHRAPDRLQPAPLPQQPRGEPRAGLDAHALEELAAETGERHRVGGRPRLQHVYVDRGVPRQPETDGRPAPDGVGTAQQPAELRQVPAQRAGGILRIGEQEIRQVLARRWLLAQRQVRQQRPYLLAPWRRVNDCVADHEGRTEQPGLDAHGAHPAPQRARGARPLTRTVTRWAHTVGRSRSASEGGSPWAPRSSSCANRFTGR